MDKKLLTLFTLLVFIQVCFNERVIYDSVVDYVTSTQKAPRYRIDLEQTDRRAISQNLSRFQRCT